MDRIENMEDIAVWAAISRAARAPPGLESYNSLFSDLDLQASKLLNGGLGTQAPGLEGRPNWPVQEALRWQEAITYPPKDVPQVKRSPIISLSDRLESNAGLIENRKAPPTEPVPAPPGSVTESERARSQRFAPKKRDLLSQYAHHSGPVVTLMICNIPCRITQQQLVDVIDLMGFAGRYDFLYLPTGGRSSTVGSSNLGYGFINFTDPGDADPFTSGFTNYQFEGTSSTKVCTVRPAHIQGLENNILHFDRTAAKGRPRREGPFIRLASMQEPEHIKIPEHLTLAAYMEEDKAANAAAMAELSSCGMQETLSWLEPSYFDFLEETPDFVVAA